MTVADANQVIAADGSGNVMSGNLIVSTLTVDASCVDDLGQRNRFTNELSSALSQTLKDQQQGMTEWMIFATARTRTSARKSRPPSRSPTFRTALPR